MTTEDRVRRFIHDDLNSPVPAEQLTADFPLIDNAVIDSLGIFEMVQFIEREFGVEVADEDLVTDNFATIGDIARLVGSKAETPGS